MNECTKINPESRLNLVHQIASAAKAARQCEHIKASGEFCGSPALRGRRYCYFHLTQIGRRLRAERVHAKAMANSVDASVVPLELPAFEDANSIQIALMQVVDAILQNRLDPKRAGLVLYALQTASSNLGNGAAFQPTASALVAGRYEDFEKDFQLEGDVPELKVDEAEDQQAELDEHSAKIAQIEEMAEAYTRLDAAEEEALEKRAELGPEDDADDNQSPFHCKNIDRFFCSIMGPLSQPRNSGAQPARRREREAASQRLEMLPNSTSQPPLGGKKEVAA
jgi:hypothetical protein